MPSDSANKTLRMKVAAICVCSVLAIPIAGAAIAHFSRMREQSAREDVIQAKQAEFEHDLPNIQELSRANIDLREGRISVAEYERIERRVKARRINAADLKQADDDYKAGHINLGELHRIQREVRDREP